MLDGTPLTLGDGTDVVSLRSAFAPRVLNVHFKPVELKEGPHQLVLECLSPGHVGLDYVWIKPE
jgi:hypothetical protein